MKYTPGAKNISSGVMSRFLLDGKQNSRHKSYYTTQKQYWFYDVQELPEGIFPLNFKTLTHHQWKGTSIQHRLLHVKDTKYTFTGGQNTITLLTYKGFIVIPKIIQRYAVQYYYIYIINFYG